ncbi:MAG TPA: ROK family protein [Anaerolineae bacterium]|nr:ROK family protein [Anaerolineae bacterium]
MPCYIAVDLGGTQIRAARYGADQVRQARANLPTRAEEGPDGVLTRIEQAIRQVWPPDGGVTAIGMAAPGPLDSRRGVVYFAPNLSGWKDVPLRRWLEETFGVPSFVGNDANLAALGEHQYGAGQGVDDLIYLTISTGIGGGIILNGCLFEGGGGLGGEIGHITVDAEGPFCACGNRGCLETLASGSAIARAARAAVAAGRPSALVDRVGGDPSRITAKEVAQAAREGDRLSQEILRRAGFYIGAALVSLMYLLNPALFVIGGSVTKAGDLLFGPIRETVENRAPEVYRRGVSIRPAALGDDVGLLGALALARGRVGGDPPRTT